MEGKKERTKERRKERKKERKSYKDISNKCMQHSPLWKADSSSASQETVCFNGTRRFTVAFTIARHFSLSPAKRMQSISSHKTTLYWHLNRQRVKKYTNEL